MGSNYISEKDNKDTGSTVGYSAGREEYRQNAIAGSNYYNQNLADQNLDNQSRRDEPGEITSNVSSKNVILLVTGLVVLIVVIAAAFGGVPSREDGNANQTKSISADSVELDDSWAEIVAAGEDGTYRERYHIGNIKELDLGEEGTITMKLVAMDADELAYDNGYAPMTWVAEDLLNTEQCMNLEDTISGGWPASYMRDWLRDDILPLFPEEVRDSIKVVNKYSYDSEVGTVCSPDSLWIPSAREIFGEDYSDEEKGTDYTDVFREEESWIKYHIGDSDPSLWYLRSAVTYNDGDEGFLEGSDGGRYNRPNKKGSFYILSDVELGVLIGFCL